MRFELGYSYMMANYQRDFASFEGPREQCVMSPLLFTVFDETSIEVIVQRFAAGPVVVSELLSLVDVPNGDDEHPEKTPLEKARNAMWECRMRITQALSRSPQMSSQK